ncbi:hypothetical protein Droror1_Dr00018018 [Drosera rotundifolia]
MVVGGEVVWRGGLEQSRIERIGVADGVSRFDGWLGVLFVEVLLCFLLCGLRHLFFAADLRCGESCRYWTVADGDLWRWKILDVDLEIWLILRKENDMFWQLLVLSLCGYGYFHAKILMVTYERKTMTADLDV